MSTVGQNVSALIPTLLLFTPVFARILGESMP